MTLLSPLGLLFLVSIPLVILLYLLRVRLRTLEVSSTLLWQRLLRDLSAQDPWQRPRFTVLMLAQVLLLSFLALALARPADSALAPKSISELLIIDVSASMQARDIVPNRFAAARKAAIAAVQRLPSGSTVTVIAAGQRPAVVVPTTNDLPAAVAAVEGIEAKTVGLDVDAVLRLASAITGGSGRIDFFTDGAFDLDEAQSETVNEVHFQLTGGASNNQAITTIAVRPRSAESSRQQVFLRVHNFASAAVDGRLALFADGVLVETRDLHMPAASGEDIVFDSLPDRTINVAARLLVDDDLTSDNEAVAMIEEQRPIKVLLVSKGNVFMEHALAVLPAVQLYRTSPDRYPATDADTFDLIVFDGYLPEQMPRQSLLLINPPESALMPVAGTFAVAGSLSWQAENELLRYVSLRDLRIQRSAAVDSPSWATAIVESEGHPLLLAGERLGQRTVVVSFALQQSNLPLLSSFPILMSNIVSYLEPRTTLESHTLTAGERISLQPMPQADAMRIQMPDGTSRTPRFGKTVEYELDAQAGMYTVEQSTRGKVISREQLAVNLSNEVESDIGPRIARQSSDSGTVAQVGLQPRELWPWLVLGALGLLIGEWWWYHRRAR